MKEGGRKELEEPGTEARGPCGSNMCTYVLTHVCVSVDRVALTIAVVYVCACTYTCVCICVYTCMHVYVCVCVCACGEDSIDFSLFLFKSLYWSKLADPVGFRAPFWK